MVNRHVSIKKDLERHRICSVTSVVSQGSRTRCTARGKRTSPGASGRNALAENFNNGIFLWVSSEMGTSWDNGNMYTLR